MTRINIHDAKTHLSRYVERVEQGETFLLCKRNVPVAEIRPVAKPAVGRRPIGLAKGTFEVPDEFFEPLPDDVLDLFEGRQSKTSREAE